MFERTYDGLLAAGRGDEKNLHYQAIEKFFSNTGVERHSEETMETICKVPSL